VETRRIHISSVLKGYLKFPYVETTFRLDRHVTDLDGSNPRGETVYGLTSIPGTDKRAAERILALVRSHWTIENGLHWVRDVTFDEDRSQVRKGNGPRVMATLRNLVISVLNMAEATSIAKATRWCCRNLPACLRLIGMKTSDD
jgi:Transposase DDE domain